MALEVGSRLGRYHVTAKIDEGSMGKVCPARTPHENRNHKGKGIG